MKYKILEPGKRGKFYYVRGSHEGWRFEFSTRTTDRIRATERAAQFAEEWQKPDGRADHREDWISRTTPKAMPLSMLEKYLLANFSWVAGNIIGPNGRHFRPYRTAHGYRQFDVMFQRERRRFYVHRLVFLLTHGWLPESIDHIDRDRGNNSPNNLRPSTPVLQSANTAQRKNRGVPQSR